MTAPLTARQVAAELGLSLSRFRHVWRDYVRGRAFPPPVSAEDAHLKWDADDVADWKRRRARALGGDGRQTPANDIHPADHLPLNPTIPIPASSPALDRQRNTLRALMAKGA